MSLRLRLLALMLAVYCAGGYVLARWAEAQVRPRYLESMEETLVDTSVLLAAMVETSLPNEKLDEGDLRRVFTAAQARNFEARVFSLTKTSLDLSVYLTDDTGKVLFDSRGRDVGRDYSQWVDVQRTLRGQYGARSSRDIAGDDNTQVIYVAAPILRGGRIVGVVSVGKHTRGINQLVAVAKQRLRLGIALGGVAILLAMLTVAAWVVAPLERLTAYARDVRDGRAVTLPPLPGRTLHDLGRAFEEMRDSLEGRQHVERYTQTMAHEVKAPLAAIRGAAELLDEEMPLGQRKKFLGNIRQESARIQEIIDRLLELSSLEARKTLRQIETMDAGDLAREAAAALGALIATAKLNLTLAGGEGVRILGERILLREALINLLQNAVDFTAAGGQIDLQVKAETARVIFVVEDNGAGVPEFALERVFERFYSLPRPTSGRKSTGLGLSLVREIAHLHGGEAQLSRRLNGGTRAEIWVPLASPRTA